MLESVDFHGSGARGAERTATSSLIKQSGCELWEGGSQAGESKRNVIV